MSDTNKVKYRKAILAATQLLDAFSGNGRKGDKCASRRTSGKICPTIIKGQH